MRGAQNRNDDKKDLGADNKGGIVLGVEGGRANDDIGKDEKGGPQRTERHR